MENGSSSVLLTNTGKLRKRISKACNYCRQRKIKCDGNPTMCQNCRNHTIECTYSKSARKKKSKIVKKVTKKMTLSEIQKKTEQMDDNLASLNRKMHQILEILKDSNLKVNIIDKKPRQQSVGGSEDSDGSEYDEYESGEEEEEEEEDEEEESELSESEVAKKTFLQEPQTIEKVQDQTSNSELQLSIPKLEFNTMYTHEFSPMSTTHSIDDIAYIQHSASLNLQMSSSPSHPVYKSNEFSSSQIQSMLSPNSDSISSSVSLSTLSSNDNNGTDNTYTPHFLLESNTNMNSIKYQSTVNDINRIDEELTMLNAGISQFYKNDLSLLNSAPVDLIDPFGVSSLQ